MINLLKFEMKKLVMKDVDIQDILQKIKEYDANTYLHSVRVSYYATQLAKEIGMDEETIEKIRKASLIHDIGKIRIPAEIIKGKEKLTPKTRTMVNEHTKKGLQYLESKYEIIPELYMRAVLLHHERADGSGYPFGLTSPGIGIETEIISVADVYDAMISERSYKKSLSDKDVIDYFTVEAADCFNKEVVSILVKKIIPENNEEIAL